MKSALVNGLGALSPALPRASCWLRNSLKVPGLLCFHSLNDCFFAAVRRHYHAVKLLTTCKVPVDAAGLSQYPIASLPSTAGATSLARE